MVGRGIPEERKDSGKNTVQRGEAADGVIEYQIDVDGERWRAETEG